MVDHEGIIKGSLLVKRAEETGRAGSSAGNRMAYSSSLVDHLRANQYRLTLGRVTLLCAEKFGFCWGVDKAVDIVEEAMAAYPGKKMWILNQIIHNPAVNRDFLTRGVQFIRGDYAKPGGFDAVSADDVAIIPAFSAEVEDIARLKEIGCTIIDTTCPWVLKPHLRTKRNIEAGFTTVIHATLGHDETNATCSLIQHEGGKYLVVRDLTQTDLLCGYLEGRVEAADLLGGLGEGISPGFDPSGDLEQIALINQTTMLASESREIGRRVEASMQKRFEKEESGQRFRDFDTICTATQENQDAMVDLVDAGELDLMLVVGGYNSSNTRNLARIAQTRGLPTYHIEDATSLQPERIQHQPVGSDEVVGVANWFPAEGDLRVGFTAGASTPDTKLAAVMARVAELAGVSPEDLPHPA